MPPSYPVCDGPTMLQIDQRVIAETGIVSEIFMENAASAVVAGIHQEWQGKKSTACVVCGPGNNGADGLVVARRLAAKGWGRVDIIGVNRDIQKFFARNDVLENMFVLDTFSAHKYDVVVDALLGAGSRPHPKQTLFQPACDWINASSGYVVAVDLPSGICPSSGVLLVDRPVKADLTVSFGALKWGTVMYPGRSFCGRKIIYSEIGFPAKFLRENSCMHLYVPSAPAPRDPCGHKGSFGRCVFVAGSEQYFGAPLFACGGFFKAGGGYARLVAADPEATRSVAARLPGVVLCTLVEPAIDASDCMVIGPGLGVGRKSQLLFQAALDHAITGSGIKKIIIDGDGLSMISKEWLERLLSSGVPVVLTPHLGELNRMLWPADSGQAVLPHDEPRPTVFTEYVAAVSKIFASMHAFPGELIMVIKGARTCVVSSSCVRINVSGNSGLAKAGSGDVLSGIIAAMREDSIFDQVAQAVFIHGLAGDMARDDMSEEGVSPEDVMARVPLAMRTLRQGDGVSKYFPEMSLV